MRSSTRRGRAGRWLDGDHVELDPDGVDVRSAGSPRFGSLISAWTGVIKLVDVHVHDLTTNVR